MSFTRISAIVLRQYYLTRDNPTRLLQLFLWAILEITLWGFVSAYLAKEADVRFEFVFIGGIILWEFLIRTMYGVSVAFFEDVWARNFLNMFASPLSIREYLIGMVVSSILTTALSFSVMLVFAWAAFGYTILSYGLFALPFLLILFFFGVALGILGVTMVLRFGPSAEWFIWPLPALVAPFAGVFYPVETLPHWMQSVAYFLPPTYVFEGLRAIVAGKGIETGPLLMAIAIGVVFVTLAYALFVRVYRHAVRTGLLARYSAETVS